MKHRNSANAIVLALSICTMGAGFVSPAAAAQASAVPRLPATPDAAIVMLGKFNDATLKAALAQPGLKGRVETLLGLGGCDWTVNANVARQATTRNAATYLNSMEDPELRAALADASVSDRIDTAFKRDQCGASAQSNPVTTVFPAPTGSSNQYPDPRSNPYPYGYPGDPRYPGGYPNGDGPAPGAPYGGYGPGNVPGSPYGGYGSGYPGNVPGVPNSGYGPGYPGPSVPGNPYGGGYGPGYPTR